MSEALRLAAPHRTDGAGRPGADGTAPARLGECVAVAEAGRAEYLVRQECPRGGTSEQWLEALGGHDVRAGDRVLLLLPENATRPVIVGVVGGGAQAARPHERRVALAEGETLKVTTADGRELVEIRSEDEGAVLRLGGDDLSLEVPGKLRLSSEEMELRARQGDVKIESESDVVLRGQFVRLN